MNMPEGFLSIIPLLAAIFVCIWLVMAYWVIRYQVAVMKVMKPQETWWDVFKLQGEINKRSPEIRRISRNRNWSMIIGIGYILTVFAGGAIIMILAHA